MSTDRGTRQGHVARPNLVLIARREQRGWSSRRRAARELHRLWTEHLPGPPTLESLEKTLYRHETGRTEVRDEMYRKLYCLAYDATPRDLFGDGDHDVDDSGIYTVRSHKFIPAFVGVDAVHQLIADDGMSPACDQWLDCHTRPLPAPDGCCDLYAWPFGVVMLHLVEELAFPNLASLAVWRQRTYAEHLRWASDQFRTLVGDPTVEAAYILSLYWLLTATWPGDRLDTALRVLSMPKVLLEHSVDLPDALGPAELVERSLLDDGFDHPGLVPFGVQGTSIGYASWSGVVYHPLAQQRALSEVDLVACELATQAVWAYCGYINHQVEQGRDPVVAEPYGWRFLRATRSRLVTARPQETWQHKPMRSAIIETCGIIDHLAHAIETLREIQEG